MLREKRRGEVREKGEMKMRERLRETETSERELRERVCGSSVARGECGRGENVFVRERDEYAGDKLREAESQKMDE